MNLCSHEILFTTSLFYFFGDLILKDVTVIVTVKGLGLIYK